MSRLIFGHSFLESGYNPADLKGTSDPLKRNTCASEGVKIVAETNKVCVWGLGRLTL